MPETDVGTVRWDVFLVLRPLGALHHKLATFRCACGLGSGPVVNRQGSQATGGGSTPRIPYVASKEGRRQDPISKKGIFTSVSLVRAPTSVLLLVSLCAQSCHFDMHHSSLLPLCYFSHLSILVTDTWDPLLVWVSTVRPLSLTSFLGNPN
jgi:hypothetical protein